MISIRSLAIDARAGALGRMTDAEELSVAALHERHLGDVYRYVLQRVRRIEEAEDITAEVFAAAAAGLARFRGHCPPHLWLLSIARRKVIDAGRRRSVRRELLVSEIEEEGADAATLRDAVSAVEGPETALMRTEARRVLRRLLADLHPDQREAVLLHHMEQLPAAEIAIVMGRSLSAVYSLLKRARATLRARGYSYFMGDDEGQKP